MPSNPGTALSPVNFGAREMRHALGLDARKVRYLDPDQPDTTGLRKELGI
jgi:hypothetical protein